MIKIKGLLLLLTSILLCGCSVKAQEQINHSFEEDRLYSVSYVDWNEEQQEDLNKEDTDIMKGIWVSQFDMHPIYRDGNKQRDTADYTKRVKTMISNLKRDGFNTVFLQLRPNGDSMYESEVYPLSKYIAGSYGGSIDYDAIEIFLDIAKANDISVHAWINPYRLCKEEELIAYGKGTLYEWYKEGLGNRIELGDDGILYLDPAYKEVDNLIVAGVREILNKYDFHGIHMDDYFYPTEFEFKDEKEFLLSGYEDRGDFRRANIDRTVKAIYNAVHEYEGKIFGIAPAGNIYSLSEGWYVDIYKWCSTDGYVDYILPQLYFGFKNDNCPFETVLKDWADAVTNSDVSLYIGLSAAKCVLGSQGIADEYAGMEGQFEWRDSKDILKRSFESINECPKASGFCVFTYSSFYDPLTGEDNDFALVEKNAFCQIIKES